MKAEVHDLKSKTFLFVNQKTMYGGKNVSEGDVIFVFASENEGGPGLIARGIVIASKPMPLKPDVERQTPRASVTIERTALANRRLGRGELSPFSR